MSVAHGGFTVAAANKSWPKIGRTIHPRGGLAPILGAAASILLAQGANRIHLFRPKGGEFANRR
jgi:hypothetical protein